MATVYQVSAANDPAADRDFYLQLLDLSDASDPEPLLARALSTIVDASGAHTVYIELREPDDDRDAAPRYWKAHGCSDADVAAIQQSISRGIVARTLAEGRTIATPSAVEDPALRDHQSVLRNDIQAVLCAPIGNPAYGAVYLRGPRAGEDFTTRNRKPVEVFARQLGLVAARLMRHRAGESTDATAEIRKQFRCDDLLGRSPAFAHVLKEAAVVAGLHTNVLITGPTGTGKSAMARAIASNSRRASGPFIDLNCANLQESMLEAEMFGAEVGAYTGATKKMIGKVTAARGGTLFLDEIAELGLGTQAKLLQLLNDRKYYPLGSTTALIADIRLVCATHQDLAAMVAKGTFRADLFHRLDGMVVRMPSLDERRDDIPDLVEHLCASFCDLNELQLKPTLRLLWRCREIPWPGNIRELAKRIEVGIARAAFERSTVLDDNHVFPEISRSDGPPTYKEATRRAQCNRVREALESHNWNVVRAAAELDISRQYLHELMKLFGLERPE